MADCTTTWENLYTTEEWIQGYRRIGDLTIEDERALEWVADNHPCETHDGYRWHSIMVDAYEEI